MNRPMNRLLRRWRLRRRMMRVRADFAMQNNGRSAAKCPHCRAWFFADSETEAGLRLSAHCAFFHDPEPDEAAR